MVQRSIAVRRNYLTATGNHMPYRIIIIYYFEIQHATIQQQKYKVHNTVVHTWILKDEQVATYIAPENRNKIHLVDTMPIHGIL